MRQINIRLSDEEFDLVMNHSAEVGMLPSALCKYYVLLGSKSKMTPPSNPSGASINNIQDMMVAELKKKKKGETFIVSALLDPSTWVSLTRGEKAYCSSELKKFVLAHPSEYALHNKIGNINLYIVL